MWVKNTSIQSKHVINMKAMGTYEKVQKKKSYKKKEQNIKVAF